MLRDVTGDDVLRIQLQGVNQIANLLYLANVKPMEFIRSFKASHSKINTFSFFLWYPLKRVLRKNKYKIITPYKIF